MCALICLYVCHMCTFVCECVCVRFLFFLKNLQAYAYTIFYTKIKESGLKNSCTQL